MHKLGDAWSDIILKVMHKSDITIKGRFIPRLAAVLAIVLAGCASTDQTESEVYKRISGGKLEKWLSLHDAAVLHWPYAWAAVAAYQDADDPKRGPLDTTAECPEPNSFLEAQEWELWKELPMLKQEGQPSLASEKMRDVHLRAQVWANSKEGKVVVAFGGTAATSYQDWKSNLRWLLAPFHPHDAYEVLSETFIPVFVAAYQQRSALPDGDWLKKAQLISTGHSLGGGLAQRFAYEINGKSDVPRIREIFAFDPSPVSGKRGVDHWQESAKGLTIYRIYNRGETLASIRSIFAMVEDPPEGEGQKWIDIRYRENWSWKTLLPSGSVHAHGIFDLACFMKRAMEIPPPGQESLS